MMVYCNDVRTMKMMMMMMMTVQAVSSETELRGVRRTCRQAATATTRVTPVASLVNSIALTSQVYYLLRTSALSSIYNSNALPVAVSCC